MLVPGVLYHIYNRGNNRERLFREAENYRYFLERYSHYLADHIDTYAYCLMPTHFHFLVSVKDSSTPTHPAAGNLTPWKKGFVISLSAMTKASISVTIVLAAFLIKFKRKPVTQSDHLLRLIVYIYGNPVKAGLCTDFAGWMFSSYGVLIRDETTSLQREEVLGWFNGQLEFIAFHQAYFKEVYPTDNKNFKSLQDF
jgi:putative transposase